MTLLRLATSYGSSSPASPQVDLVAFLSAAEAAKGPALEALGAKLPPSPRGTCSGREVLQRNSAFQDVSSGESDGGLECRWLSPASCGHSSAAGRADNPEFCREDPEVHGPRGRALPRRAPHELEREGAPDPRSPRQFCRADGGRSRVRQTAWTPKSCTLGRVLTGPRSDPLRCV